MLTTAQLYELTKDGSNFETDTVITFDVMADHADTHLARA